MPRSLLRVVLLAAVGQTFAANPVPEPRDACAVTADLASADEFYPPGPTRREEEGKVVIELTAEPGAQHAHDIVIVTGSGNPDLDKAALKIGAAMRVTSACSERRARFAIEFVHGHEKKQLGIDTFRTVISVVISPAEPAQ